MVTTAGQASSATSISLAALRLNNRGAAVAMRLRNLYNQLTDAVDLAA